jgi:hypothetical protein
VNPFEDGIVSSDAIQGVMDRRVAAKGSRTVLFQERLHFYNPMWKVRDDSRNHLLGTYFLPSSTIALRSHFDLSDAKGGRVSTYNQ